MNISITETPHPDSSQNENRLCKGTMLAALASTLSRTSPAYVESAQPSPLPDITDEQLALVFHAITCFFQRVPEIAHTRTLLETLAGRTRGTDEKIEMTHAELGALAFPDLDNKAATRKVRRHLEVLAKYQEAAGMTLLIYVPGYKKGKGKSAIIVPSVFRVPFLWRLTQFLNSTTVNYSDSYDQHEAVSAFIGTMVDAVSVKPVRHNRYRREITADTCRKTAAAWLRKGITKRRLETAFGGLMSEAEEAGIMRREADLLLFEIYAEAAKLDGSNTYPESFQRSPMTSESVTCEEIEPVPFQVSRVTCEPQAKLRCGSLDTLAPPDFIDWDFLGNPNESLICVTQKVPNPSTAPSASNPEHVAHSQPATIGVDRDAFIQSLKAQQAESKINAPRKSDNYVSQAELDAVNPKAPRGTSWKQYNVCPQCGGSGKRGKFNVKVSSGGYRCHSCGITGILREHLTYSGDNQSCQLTAAEIAELEARAAKWAEAEAQEKAENVAEAKRIYSQAAPLRDVPAAVDYVRGRLGKADIAEACGVRYAVHQGRKAILFPIRNQVGDVVAVNDRAITPMEAAWKTRSAGVISDGVFATPGAFDARTVAVVEGCFDALALALCDQPAIAVIGTFVPEWLVKELHGRHVLIGFDNDQPDKNGNRAGELAAARLVEKLQGSATLERFAPSDAKDWAEVLERDGKDALAEALAILLID